MSDSFSLSHGTHLHLGATLDSEGCNFAVHCPDADRVYLCLFHPDTEEPTAEICLPAKSGQIWHGHVAGLEAGTLYGYRVEGTGKSELGLLFDKDKLLIDPYAKTLNRPLVWNPRQYQGDSRFMVPKAVVEKPDYAWRGGLKPHVPLADTVIYEAHVKGLTQLHPDVEPEHKGKFLGVCHPSVIEHLKNLGVTSIQLLPVAASMSETHLLEKGLSNYWGYNSVNFFAPDPRFAVTDATTEFRQMVKTLHDNGLEVILDVVFNHTCEAGLDGPMVSFKGFDNRAFYLYESDEFGAVDYRRYRNNSGCGNSVNTAHPYVMTMVMDALRHWVVDMGVDGFRFDLAASLGRDPHEFTGFAGFFRVLRQDPVLQKVKLIAEPWDIGHGGYRLGHFPANWQEVNDKFRDTVRAFWRGDKGLTGEFATRLLGSRDIFHKGSRSVHSSVNHISYHDGFTLEDLVSYKERHNMANGEQNRDGHGHNLSHNYGVEGPTHDDAIVSVRERQKRNLFATLVFSQGIPHVLGGDELSRSQQGNNNAYCQDNPISWVSWELNERKQDFLAFCQYCLSVRKGSQILSQLNLKDDGYYHSYNVEKVGWYRPDGMRKVVDDWHDPDNQSFAVALKGTERTKEHWLLAFNASDHEVMFKLPPVSTTWCLVLDTRYDKVDQQPLQCGQRVFTMAAKTLCLFKSEG